MARDRKTAPTSVPDVEAEAARREDGPNMDSITYTSWWARPAVQFDYAAFAAALEAELPRMTTDTSAAAKVDAAITYQWSMGFPKRRATSLRRLL